VKARAMDPRERRSLISTARNPDARIDYVADLDGQIPGAGGVEPMLVSLRYVPDRLVLVPASYGAYLDALQDNDWSSLEHVAVTVLDDINDEVVARWVQVRISGPESGHADILRHNVLVEDRQPGWDNQALLSRLKQF